MQGGRGTGIQEQRQPEKCPEHFRTLKRPEMTPRVKGTERADAELE